MTTRELDTGVGLSFEDQNKNLAEKIFGTDFLQESLIVTNKCSTSTNNIIKCVDQLIQAKLDCQGNPQHVNVLQTDTRPGRIGSPKVMFDLSSRSDGGSFSISEDNLRLNSQANFSTIKANVCFYSGKWYYELQLETKGVMQLGWDMGLKSKFSPEIGVGDTVGSYAYDGHRTRKWNVATIEYGEPWLNGDIIGCAIDLDMGSITFYRNGRSMGEAFNNIQLGPGCAYFPAVSLAFSEGIVANFGGTPFKYPIEGFEPLQLPPSISIIRASLIFTWFHKLLDFSEDKHYNLGKVDRKESDDVLKEASVLMFARLFMRQLSPLLDNTYIIEACLIPFLSTLSNVTYVVEKKGMPISGFKMKVFSEILTIFLQEEELNFLMRIVTRDLISKFRQVSNNVQFVIQKRSLTLFKSLALNSKLRDWLMRNIYFSLVRLPEFMDAKPIDEPALFRIIPSSWWEPLSDCVKGELTEEDKEKRRSYYSSCEKINLGVKELEGLQVEILEILLSNKEEGPTKPSCRKYFLNMFRYFLRDNMITVRIFPRPVRTPLPIALSYFHRLLTQLRRLWERELSQEKPHVQVSKFYDSSIQYFGIDRVGGAWTYLLKKHREALLKQLGEDHHLLKTTDQVASQQTDPEVVLSMVATTNIVPQAFRIVRLDLPNQWNFLGNFSVEYKTVDPGTLSSSDSLMELMDGLVMFYHISAHKQLQNVSGVKDNMDKYITALTDTQVKLKEALINRPSAVNALKFSLQVFENKLDELSRYMAWIKSSVYTSEKQSDLYWLLKAILSTLRKASREGDLFTFVPDFYINSLVEITTALKSYFEHSSLQADEKNYKAVFIEVAEFLALHFSDARIVNPSVKDTMIQGLAGFLTSHETLKYLESISAESRVEMAKQLLQPYDNRPWGQSNWILLRMWHGCGFAFRYQKSPHLQSQLGPKLVYDHFIHQTFKPCPSPIFQETVGEILLNDEVASSTLINSILNQLNWSFSEVIGMLQEIQNLSSRPERVFIEVHQLKVCSTCFDFTLGLLRVLEMILNVCKPVLTDTTRLNVETLLERLCQLLCQILLRVCSVSGCFYHVVCLDIPDLETIDPFPILTAVVGILVVLLQNDNSSIAGSKKDVSTVVKYLLSEPAFQINSLKYVLGEDEETNNKTDLKKTFSFYQYPEAVSEEEIIKVREIISVLTKSVLKVSSEMKDTPEEDLCLICCAMPMSVIFLPCHHKSCKSCISHFLLMNTIKDCFFCKATINSVTDFAGNVIYSVTDSKVTNVTHNMDTVDETNL